MNASAMPQFLMAKRYKRTETDVNTINMQSDANGGCHLNKTQE